MKKIYSLIMAFTLLLTFTACSNNTNDESSSSAQQQSGTPDSISADKSDNQNDSSTPAVTGSKSLVIYFSWSGNTENVAKSILIFLKSYLPHRTVMIMIPL